MAVGMLWAVTPARAESAVAADQRLDATNPLALGEPDKQNRNLENSLKYAQKKTAKKKQTGQRNRKHI